MTARVLSREELNKYERDARDMKRFPDDDLFYRFIATIRDLQQSSQANASLWEEALAEKQREIEDRDKKLETVCEQLDIVMEGNRKFSQQNTILREAIDRLDYLSKYYAAKLSCHMDKDTMEPLKLDPIAQEFADIVRETLAKVVETE